MYNDKLNEVSNHHQMRETKTNITSQLSQSLVPTIVGTIDVDTFPIRKIYQVTVNVNSINFVKWQQETDKNNNIPNILHE